VADRGPGVPPEVRGRIFEPFVTTKRTGTGLGLSIARRVVEAHGGSLAVADRPGGGALFRVTLPRTSV
jgi:two-component system sensor kinase FixL